MISFETFLLTEDFFFFALFGKVALGEEQINSVVNFVTTCDKVNGNKVNGLLSTKFFRNDNNIKTYTSISENLVVLSNMIIAYSNWI